MTINNNPVDWNKKNIFNFIDSRVVSSNVNFDLVLV